MVKLQLVDAFRNKIEQITYFRQIILVVGCYIEVALLIFLVGIEVYKKGGVRSILKVILDLKTLIMILTIAFMLSKIK